MVEPIGDLLARLRRDGLHRIPLHRIEKMRAGFGALAQLGEHLLCKQGVIGSIPIRSTNIPFAFGKLNDATGSFAKQNDRERITIFFPI